MTPHPRSYFSLGTKSHLNSLLFEFYLNLQHSCDLLSQNNFEVNLSNFVKMVICDIMLNIKVSKCEFVNEGFVVTLFFFF